MAPYLVQRGFTKETALTHLLGSVPDDYPGYERFAGRLAIPYLLADRTVALKFRLVNDGAGPKYDSPADQQARIFNAGVLATGGHIVAVCEGELDVLLVQQELGLPAVGIPGSAHWKAHWSRCFAGWDRVVMFADNDEAGLKLGHRVVKEIETAELVTCPAGMDVSEWLLADGPAAVRERAGL